MRYKPDASYESFLAQQPLGAIDPVVAELKRLGSASNRALAGRLGWSEAKVSRHVALLEQSGKVAKIRDGRSLSIKLN